MALGTFVAGATCVGYATLVETRAFALRHHRVPVLPRGADPVRLLHISDLHLMPSQDHKIAWVQGLAELQPDVVVNTGDNMSHPDSWVRVLEACAPLFGVPGVFVWGSNDYYAPGMRNPLAYFAGPSTRTKKEPSTPRTELPWRRLGAAFTEAGWLDLTHRRERVMVKGMPFAFRGTDDAHLGKDRCELVSGPPDLDAVLNLGVTHAPYQRVLDSFAADRMDLVLAGHTHGGQVCIPGRGALVTNCDIDTARVKGLSTHTAGGHTSALHVSAGLGTSPFAPYRFACRPEASLLELVPRA